MEKSELTKKQIAMVAQVAATMAIENMPLTPQAYEEASIIITGEKTADEIAEEIRKEYINAG